MTSGERITDRGASGFSAARPRSGPRAALDAGAAESAESAGAWASALFRAQQAGVFRFILGLVTDESLADDLTQDTFVAAYQRARQLRSPERGRAWLFSIARNVVRQHWRRQRIVQWVRWEDAPAPHAAHHDEAQAEIFTLLQGLTAEDREVILLKGLLGFTAREIGDILGIREEAAQQRWRRARDRARSALAPADPATRGGEATTADAVRPGDEGDRAL